MKKILTILLLTTFVVNAQNKIVWADKVLFTDGLDAEEVKNYNQILGSPNSSEGLSDKSCTFKKLGNSIQTTRVSFSLSMEAKQVIIAQNYFSGAIKEVIVFDSLGRKKRIHTSEPRAFIKNDYPAFLGVNAPKNFKIKEVEIVLNLDYVEGNACQIDAVGLLNDTIITDVEYLSYRYLVGVFSPSSQVNTDKASQLMIDLKSQRPTNWASSGINQELIDFVRNFKMQWAEKNATASSEDGYYAKNALGKPTFSLDRIINLAWQPQLGKKNEWIEVGYNTPQTVSDVLVFKNADVKYGFNMIALLDSNGKIRESFSWDDKRAVLKNQNALWHLHLEKPTSYEVAGIKIFVNTLVYGKLGSLSYTIQIDAVGISNESMKINEIVLNDEKVEKENLGKSINSKSREVGPLVTYDGKQLFFVRELHVENVGERKLQDVWTSTLESKVWGKPVNIGQPINTDAHNAASAISPNGKTLYLLNVYLPDGNFKQGISASKRINGVWSFPKELKINNSQDGEFRYGEFTIAPSRKVLIMSAIVNDDFKNTDLYVSFLNEDNTWSKPVSMGQNINTNFSEATPFMAGDNRTLYFSSKGHLGYGDADIFMSQRLDETWTNWSEPVNLGSKINTPKWDGYFNVIASGDYAYTCSEINTLGVEDIIRIKLPTNAKPKPVVILKVVIKGKNIQKIEAVEADNKKESYLADFDEETNEYILILPVDKKYNLTVIHAQNSNYQSVIDLTTYKVYTEMQKNINLDE